MALMPFLVNLDQCVSTISFATKSSGYACAAYETHVFLKWHSLYQFYLFTYLFQRNQILEVTHKFRGQLYDIFFTHFFI